MSILTLEANRPPGLLQIPFSQQLANYWNIFSNFLGPLWIVTHRLLARSASPTTSRLDENPFFALLIPQQRHHGLPKTQEQHLIIELPLPPHPRGNGVWRRQSPFMCLCSAAELAWTVGIAMEIIEVAASVKKYFSSFPYKI